MRKFRGVLFLFSIISTALCLSCNLPQENQSRIEQSPHSLPPQQSSGVDSLQSSPPSKPEIKSVQLKPSLMTSKPSKTELLAIGKRLYKEGITASGFPIHGTVAEDVEFKSSQLNCQSCHRNSGLGSQEGEVVAPIITRWALYRGNRSGPRKRPAYTDATLIRALKEGIDSGGNALDPLMPRYKLSEIDGKGLIAYLKELSAEASPGVNKDEIRFATVISDDVDAQPMLDLLVQYFKDKNNELRNPRARKGRGSFFRRQVDLAYRKWRLDIWKLKGPRSTWRDQLEKYYEDQPVFALISGMVSGDWQPIHKFCEELSIPSVLPNTNSPSIDKNNQYTLYFSKGIHLETQTVFSSIKRKKSKGVIQVFRPNSPGEEAAKIFSQLFSKSKTRTLKDWPLQPENNKAAVEELLKALKENHELDIALWVDANDLKKLSSKLSELSFKTHILSKNPSQSTSLNRHIYLSSSILGGMTDRIPPSIKRHAILAHPYCLPEDFSLRFARVDTWLKNKGIEIRQPKLQAQTYFACMVLGEALMHVRFGYYYREFILETIEHLPSRMGIFCATHPAPSFGPGQRYLSKGCYLVTFPKLKESDQLFATWSVP